MKKLFFFLVSLVAIARGMEMKEFSASIDQINNDNNNEDHERWFIQNGVKEDLIVRVRSNATSKDPFDNIDVKPVDDEDEDNDSDDLDDGKWSLKTGRTRCLFSDAIESYPICLEIWNHSGMIQLYYFNDENELKNDKEFFPYYDLAPNRGLFGQLYTHLGGKLNDEIVKFLRKKWKKKGPCLLIKVMIQ